MDTTGKKMLEDGEFHHTLTLHSSQKNPHAASGHNLPGESDIRNQNYVSSFAQGDQPLMSPGIGGGDQYSEHGALVVPNGFNFNDGGNNQIYGDLSQSEQQTATSQQPLYIYSEAEILKQKFIEQQ